MSFGTRKSIQMNSNGLDNKVRSTIEFICASGGNLEVAIVEDVSEDKSVRAQACLRVDSALEAMEFIRANIERDEPVAGVGRSRWRNSSKKSDGIEDEVQLSESAFYDPNHDKVFIRLIDGDYSITHRDHSQSTVEDVGPVFDVWEAGWGESIGVVEHFRGKWYVVGDANGIEYETVEGAIRSQTSR